MKWVLRRFLNCTNGTKSHTAIDLDAAFFCDCQLILLSTKYHLDSQLFSTTVVVADKKVAKENKFLMVTRKKKP